MPADSAAILSPSTPPHGRPRPSIRDHPVYRVLPPDAQQRLTAEGTEVDLPGDAQPPLDREHLWFVLSGVLGAFPTGSEVCVAPIVSGAVYGWDHALGSSGSRADVRPLLDVRLFRVPAVAAREALGHDWLSRFIALQAVQRLTLLEQEAACNASHRVSERLAKWLLRLHHGGNGAPLRLKQAQLAAMLGVQRTSINAAASNLQAMGAVRFSRGKASILDAGSLSDLSCRCGAMN
ncbi:Crp/Fnr family transcriptional regulator [Brevundimonas phoenicis]|uniref:Crp/Fnr family transcriptional regulator n=1 Tax=unclassified Brevundimonas TaxID=2622653 RepID=UPI0039A14B80